MGKPEHVAILKQGVAAWNQWREQNPDAGPVLADEDLSQAILEEANLETTDLQRSNLRGASLRKANLKNARLQNADLRETNLEGIQVERTGFGNADLRQARLQGTDLRGSSLVLADLSGADLRGANLEGVEFDRTGLANAVLRETDLQNADLEKAQGLRAGQLAGANLTGATLPEAVAKFEALGPVAEISQHAGKLFVSLLAACVYCWLTIATTTDVRLITNSASSPLPIIQTPIPIVGFYVAAPLLLLCLYFYFHFYMQRLWEALATLPAFFPDGAALDSKAYPWLLNGLVRSYFPLLKKDRPALSRLQVFLATLLAWWLVPLTLFCFWWRYLFRHHLDFTLLHVFLFVCTCGAAFALRRLAAATLRGKERRPFVWKKFFEDRRSYQWAAGLAVMAAMFLGLGQVSRTAIFGSMDSDEDPSFEAILVGTFRADLIEADVSTKPESWTGLDEREEEEVALVKRARLVGRNLRYAVAIGGFFVKADLSRADLRGTDLSYADLQGAWLVRADLQEADLDDANLQGATLNLADLREADLNYARLQGASLASADLRGADLRFAAGLTASLVQEAQNWWLAYYSDDILKQLDLSSDHNARVEKALDLLEKGKEEEFQKLSEEIRKAVTSDEWLVTR